MMEAWLIADRDALSRFYGQRFNANAIPRNPNVEQVGKQDLESALKDATRHTAKGEYHKIHHGPNILSQLDVARVRIAASHCNRLFITLADRINSP
jgi:acyl-coenzyme A thioesterase PaaI-like protein